MRGVAMVGPNVIIVVCFCAVALEEFPFFSEVLRKLLKKDGFISLGRRGLQPGEMASDTRIEDFMAFTDVPAPSPTPSQPKPLAGQKRRRSGTGGGALIEFAETGTSLGRGIQKPASSARVTRRPERPLDPNVVPWRAVAQYLPGHNHSLTSPAKGGRGRGGGGAFKSLPSHSPLLRLHEEILDFAAFVAPTEEEQVGVICYST